MLDETPTATLDAVLGRLNDALEQGDAKAAAALFQADSYWRDLVAFTWNIKTMEGPGPDPRHAREPARADQAAAACGSTRGRRRPRAGDVTEGWFAFETEAGRGYGHIRLKDGLIWTLLTTLTELKGFEEPKASRRPMGAEHGHDRNRKTWKEKREARRPSSATRRSPTSSIIGGGQGGIALGARLRQLGVPTIIVEKNERPGDSGASATSRSACTTRSGTTTCPTCPSRRTGRCSRRRTRSATGSRCTPR